MVRLLNLLGLRLKIMFNHKSFWLIYLIVTILIAILVSQLYLQVEKGIQIPVGIVDEDQSEFSKYVLEALGENDLITIVDLEYSQIEEAVKDQQVEAVYIINKNAEKKVIQGDIEGIIEVIYLDENNFTMMLTDILSGDFLDEICIIIASRYYVDGYKEYVSDQELPIFNEVYTEGHQLKNVNSENYYLNIKLVGENNKELSFYNQSIVLEKMTIGIVYVFIGFFILFEGLHILRDRNTDVYKRLKISGVSIKGLNLSELLSLMISGVLITLPMTIIAIYFGKDVKSVIILNCLFIISMSSFIYLFLHVIKGIKSYILIGTSVIIGMGIVSGSFFSVDLTSSLIKTIAMLFPTYYSVNGYFDKAIIVEYSIYTSVFLLLSSMLCLMIDIKSTKE